MRFLVELQAFFNDTLNILYTEIAATLIPVKAFGQQISEVVFLFSTVLFVIIDSLDKYCLIELAS